MAKDNYGVCQGCGYRKKLTQKGVISSHQLYYGGGPVTGRQCDGSWKPPRSVKEKFKDIANGRD